MTGASAGIGKAIVKNLVDHGLNVIATGRREAALDALASKYGTERLPGLQAANDGEFVAKLAASASHVDILVSNAGVLEVRAYTYLTYDDIEEMVHTNVLGTFRITHEIAKAMVERGHGHIIVMTSTAAREVYPLGSIYCATKHALSAFANALRIELQAKGVKVSEIAPAWLTLTYAKVAITPM